ncbi:Panacea domain-containing protein [Allobaculum sp. JKK-2023]|uniref:Panacea domain-containing protein n=1 Tax=Allobaculum sp. JKK-2023 TaxID=3108943 RepID=UPI002B052B39|nr:type II toxin-antitoxin system antitoxin SocA domain-containing protein [Allobaculum sp. JKK-2023]
MSNKKLQKLTYYAYAWTLALLNENAEKMQYHLFNEPIEAWVHGPVIPDLYQKYKEYGWMDIPKDNPSFNFSPDELDILNQVWDAYGSFSATH